jgi:tetratricopeptide (TPR) repeat protein
MKDYDQAILIPPPTRPTTVVWFRPQGHSDRAIEDYDRAIRFDPNLALAFNNRANAHSSKGDLRRPSRTTTKPSGWTPGMPLPQQPGGYGALGTCSAA